MKGAYLLVIQLRTGRTIDVGARGPLLFESGWYVYVGSAKRGIEQRVARHLRREKKLFWHIDYLLAVDEASIVEIYKMECSEKTECPVAAGLSGKLGSVEGFGCSDCRCVSHLFRHPEKEALDTAIRETLKYLNLNVVLVPVAVIRG